MEWALLKLNSFQHHPQTTSSFGTNGNEEIWWWKKFTKLLPFFLVIIYGQSHLISGCRYRQKKQRCQTTVVVMVVAKKRQAPNLFFSIENHHFSAFDYGGQLVWEPKWNLFKKLIKRGWLRHWYRLYAVTVICTNSIFCLLPAKFGLLSTITLHSIHNATERITKTKPPHFVLTNVFPVEYNYICFIAICHRSRLVCRRMAIVNTITFGTSYYCSSLTI